MGWVHENTDCDDTDILTHPDAPELPDDGISQDCVGGDLVLSDATGVFVAKTGHDVNPGTMASPKLTIGAGATLADANGKSVFVAAGDYTEDVETQVSLFGGYESIGWARDIDANVTTINALTNIAVYCYGPAPKAVEGFSISGGMGGDTSVGVYNTGGSASLASNLISGGSGAFISCSVYNLYDTVTLVNNTLDGGSATDGLGDSIGVANMNGKAMLVNNAIDSGSPTGDSSSSNGVYNYGTTMLSNNTIDGGSGKFSYGMHNIWGMMTMVDNDINGGSGNEGSFGVYNEDTTTLINNTINGGSDGNCYGVYNTATMMLTGNFIHGGLATGDFSSSYGVVNSAGAATLANNMIDSGLGDESWGVYSDEDGMLILMYNDIWGVDMDCMIYDGDHYECDANTIAEINACAWYGCEEASGNISDDPLFVDAASGDFHLQDTSPCIDTGIDPVPDYIDPGFVEFDFEGDARPYGAGWDIGADEWTP